MNKYHEFYGVTMMGKLKGGPQFTKINNLADSLVSEK